jgi:hypothetical protein
VEGVRWASVAIEGGGVVTSKAVGDSSSPGIGGNHVVGLALGASHSESKSVLRSAD